MSLNSPRGAVIYIMCKVIMEIPLLSACHFFFFLSVSEEKDDISQCNSQCLQSSTERQSRDQIVTLKLHFTFHASNVPLLWIKCQQMQRKKTQTNTFFTQMHLFDKRKIKPTQCIIAERKGEDQRAIGLNGNLACLNFTFQTDMINHTS